MNNTEIEIPALCFGPGISPGGQRVIARVTPAAFEVDVGDGRVERVPWFTLQIASGGFDHQQMLLSWARGDEQWSVMPIDAAARDALRASAPPEAQVRLAHWNKKVNRTHRGFRLGWSALGLVIASPVILLFLLWLNSATIVGWVVDAVSVQSEMDMGKIFFAQVEASTPLIKEGKALQAITEMGNRLTKGSPYTYHWTIAKDPVINAFAMPGGYVVVNSGLINAAADAEEVAGVLAHEVQHVERRHSLKGLVHNLGLSAAFNVVLGDVGGGLWGNVATQLGTLKYGRDHESEADRLGYAALNKAHINAQGMLRFFEKLKAKDGATISLLSTHPATTDRLAALETLIQQQVVADALPLQYDWAAIKAEIAQ